MCQILVNIMQQIAIKRLIPLVLKSGVPLRTIRDDIRAALKQYTDYIRYEMYIYRPPPSDVNDEVIESALRKALKSIDPSLKLVLYNEDITKCLRTTHVSSGTSQVVMTPLHAKRLVADAARSRLSVFQKLTAVFEIDNRMLD